MKPGMRMGDLCNASVIKQDASKPRFLVYTLWDVEHLRRQRHGSIYKWDLVTPVTRDGNVCTDEGLNRLLDVMFHATTQITTWYVAIFESNTTPAAGTTYATPVYTESTAYDEATRPEYVVAAASAKSITNSANKAEFTMNASKTIYGATLLGGGSTPNTKADAAGGGVIYSSCQFGSAKSVVDDDVIRVTITINTADT